MKLTASCLCVLPLAAIPLAAPPDIAPFRIPRQGETLAPVEPTQIAMRSESVEITLLEDTAHVQAVFQLENTADVPETLEVGFPSAAQPSHYRVGNGNVEIYGWGEDAIANFTATVDGEPVETHRVAKPKERERIGHHYWLCWNMTVAAGARATVEVAYDVATADPNYVPPGPLQNRQVSYVLITGKGWKDPIGHARIVVRPAAGLTVDHVAAAEPAPTRRDATELTWTLTDFEPDTDIVVLYHVYADAKDAVARIAPKLEKSPDEPTLLLDYAENLEALERWREAVDAFARLGRFELDRQHPYRRPQVDYVPPLYRAALCAGKAGDDVRARELREQAADHIRSLLARLERPSVDIRKTLYGRAAALRAMLAELEAR